MSRPAHIGPATPLAGGSPPAELGPLRTCVGCRRTVPQGTLLRLVIDASGQLVVDERRRHSGRGAWVHRAATCVHNAAKGGLARSFRRKVDAAPLVNWPYSESKLARSSDLGGGESTLATATEKS